MDTEKKLVQARINETVAQRRYDFSTVLASSMLTVLGLTIPLLVALFLWFDSEDKGIRDELDNDVATAQARHDEFADKCLTASNDPRTKEISSYYCNEREYAAKTLERQQRWANLIHTDGVNLFKVYLVIGSLAASVGAGMLLYVRFRTAVLEDAQARRIALEAGMPDPPPTLRNLRRRTKTRRRGR